MAKSKTELSKEAFGYFDKYPKTNKIYTIGDGNFFLEENKSAAKTYAAQKKSNLITFLREELEDEETENNKYPEGEPDETWTKAEIMDYAAEIYPDLKLTKSMKEATLLDKIAEEKAAAEKQETSTNEAADNSAEQ